MLLVKINGILLAPEADSLAKIAEDYRAQAQYMSPYGWSLDNLVITSHYWDRVNGVVMHKTEFTGVIYDTICKGVDVLSNAVHNLL